MKLTVDISMYPLHDNYKDPIRWLIKRLDSYPGVERVTNSLSTQVSGEFDEVMRMLSIEMKAAYEQFGKAIFVCKFLEGEFDLTRRT
ncbi:hypothetical protein KDN34_06825 [Shewanella yunxiaonensis]|uniref:Thiamin/hydroxymethyl pyrimidine-binding YkoF putative domain-containing protein n=1 Tax=Shewanella yunxiaonensis TaxID=2829809 RepID=A0ABX7YWQ7_9GAMM|nr:MULTISPECIES: hypothetical protein [Shewanella]MDF0533525.1 hypothetical protein [Shewanella sp. A32]QUN07137.1 hypothetical protein KDN34_06825 [Shewanella yunxiaonensis]